MSRGRSAGGPTPWPVDPFAPRAGGPPGGRPPTQATPRPGAGPTPSRRPGNGAGHRSDLSRLARGGALNFVGSIANGVFGFALVLVVTRMMGRQPAGVFFEAVALLGIATNIVQLGADDGLVRMIPRYRALGETSKLRRMTKIALGPVLVVATLTAVVMFVLAPQLSHLFVHGTAGKHSGALIPYLHVLAPVLPLAALSSAILAGTRGFGTMVPFVAVDNFGKPALRPLLIGLALAAGLGSTAIALSWALPAVVGFGVAAYAMYRLVRRAERRDRERGFRLDRASVPRWAQVEQGRPGQSLASEFWRFSAPRGLAAVFGVTVFWLDTLLVGALRSPEDTAVYTAATRYTMVGMFALTAVQLAIGPMISRLTTVGGRDQAQRVYRTATAWLMGLAWPIYLTLAVFAPLLLRVFGSDYDRGQGVLMILSLSLLLSTAAGPVMVVLLMAGKSTWNLANAAVSLTLNVVLNLILIPRLGITGAALAWMASITFNNVAGMLEAAYLLKLRPFGRGPFLVAASSAVLFGALGLATRVVFGLNLLAFLAFGVVASAAYIAFVWRNRDALHLMELREAIRLRRQRMATRAGVVDDEADLPPAPDGAIPGTGGLD